MQKDFKYADLLNDDVFKLVFGQESSKDVMIEFLNHVIPDRTIVDVEYMDKEMHPDERSKKTSVFDLLCKTDNGSRVIVELQKRKQDHYAERMLYYSMHQILKQVDSGNADFDFYPVYVISILDFTLEQNREIKDVRTVYRLLEEKHNRLLTDRITYIFLELPKVRKSVKELNGDVLEGMCFCLKNIRGLQSKPDVLTHRVFDKIFWITEFLNMDEDLRSKIKKSMTTERDLKNQFAYARKEGLEFGRKEGLKLGREEGREEGREKEKEEIARRMLAAGLDVEQIDEFTKLGVDRIKKLQG